VVLSDLDAWIAGHDRDRLDTLPAKKTFDTSEGAGKRRLAA
jgi:hypothetical protein